MDERSHRRSAVSCSWTACCLCSIVVLYFCHSVTAQVGPLTNIGAFCKGSEGGKVPGAWCNQYIECGMDGTGVVQSCAKGKSFSLDLMDCDDEANVWCPYGQRGFWRQMMPSGGLVSIHCTLVPFTNHVIVWQRGGAWWVEEPQPGMAVPGSELLNQQGKPWEQLSALQDPFTNTYQAYQVDPAFCSGQSQMPDGRILVCGGDYINMSGRLGETSQGIDECRIFKCWDPEDLTKCNWENIPERMSVKRWYPTQLQFPPYGDEGHFTVVVGGSGVGQDPERWYDLYQNLDVVFPYKQGKQMYQIDPITFTERLGNMNMYPNMFLLPKLTADKKYQFFIWSVNYGEILELSNVLTTDPKKANPLKTMEVLPALKTDKGENVSVTYPSGGCFAFHGLEYPWNHSAKVTIFGGHAGTFNDFLEMDKLNAGSTGVNLAWTMDLMKNRTRARPSALNVSDDTFWQMEMMPDNAVLRDCVLLPTGKVALVSGARMGRAKASNNGDGCSKEPLYHPWIFDPKSPVNKRFYQDASVQPTFRAYHSCSLLMPDGSIYSAGTETGPATDDTCNGPRDYHYQVDGYVPMQVYAGILDGTRPKITNNTHHIVLGTMTNITFTGQVDECSLYKPGAQTHQLNMSLRLAFLRTVQLQPWNPATPKVNGWILVQVPPNELIIQEGPTMLFCLWKRRLYSEGVWIHLDAPGKK